MENMEFNTWQMWQEYWALKYEIAELEKDYIMIKIQKLKDGDEIVD